MSAAEHYAQGLEDLAAWVRANAEHLDAEGLDLRMSEAFPIVTPAVWVELRDGLDGNDATINGSGYVVVEREFGPVDFCLYAADSVDEAARELTGGVA